MSEKELICRESGVLLKRLVTTCLKAFCSVESQERKQREAGRGQGRKQREAGRGQGSRHGVGAGGERGAGGGGDCCSAGSAPARLGFTWVEARQPAVAGAEADGWVELLGGGCVAGDVAAGSLCYRAAARLEGTAREEERVGPARRGFRKELAIGGGPLDQEGGSGRMADLTPQPHQRVLRRLQATSDALRVALHVGSAVAGALAGRGKVEGRAEGAAREAAGGGGGASDGMSEQVVGDKLVAANAEMIAKADGAEIEDRPGENQNLPGHQ
eukprot:768556-Hanusia_phi.AAC.9